MMHGYDLGDLDILIVEKNPLLRTVFRQVLQELGVGEAEASSSIKDAWEKFNADDPDIVLVDWSPGFDGLGLLRRIRWDDKSVNRYVPVIVMSANTESAEVTKARDQGITEYLAKPVSPKALYERIVAISKQDRCFVKADGFFGPDRRRKNLQFAGEERRAANAAAAE